MSRYRTKPSAKAVCAGLLLLIVNVALCDQLLRPRQPMPSFEVTSVRLWQPSRSSDDSTSVKKIRKVVPVGAVPAVTDRVHFIGQVELLIEAAYGLPFSSTDRVLGGPTWIRSESDRYEVIGKIDDLRYAAIQRMTPLQQHEQVSLMEQTLLADRFKLKVHFEAREMPRYALALAKGGSKLKPSRDGEASQLSFLQIGQETEVKATAVTLEELAQSPFLRTDRRQIANLTGLAGAFDFALTFRTDSNAGSSDTPDLFTALQEQLGLKLVADNGPVEVVVIDHIEQPTEN